DLMEKTIIFASAFGQKCSASLCKLVENYAEILSSQGQLSTAMDYLNLLGTDDLSAELVILRDRISRFTEHEKEVEKSAASGINLLQNGSAYGDGSGYGVADGSQHYYPDPTASQIQQTVPGSQYGENYLHPSVSTYGGRVYNAPPTPTVYQPNPQPTTIPQPSIFVPQPAAAAAPTPQIGNFPPPVNTQPPVKFIPANPPLLRNVDQYQQPSTTIGSQLYPGATTTPNYQVAPPPNAYGVTTSQVGPQVLAPVPSRGFTPVSSSGFQRPATPPVVQTPAAPPPSVQTVDTSNVPAEQKPVIATLTRLFNETSEALGGAGATNPAKKREIEDNSKRLGSLFAKLNSGDISKSVAEKLMRLCRALDVGDSSTVHQIQVDLAANEWDECNFWLSTLKRMTKPKKS
ncbi:hypothetical protein M569_04603, partial [Genlisea aurea]